MRHRSVVFAAHTGRRRRFAQLFVQDLDDLLAGN